MAEFARRKINFTAVKVNNDCNLMIEVMKNSYGAEGMVLNVTDLTHACATKSQNEISKDFVKAATSYMLSITGGSGKGKSSVPGIPKGYKPKPRG